MRFAKIKVHSGELLRLDLLRFVASAGIVWHHSHEFFYPVAERAAVARQTQALALFVDLFFVLSGFVIAYVYDGRVSTLAQFGRFMQRRIGRLVPLHWLTMLLVWAFWMLVAWLGLDHEHPVDTSAECLLRTGLLTQSVAPCPGGASPNGVSWSISVEMLLYLLFPLFLPLLRRRWLLAAAIAATLAFAVSQALRFDVEWDKIYQPLRGFPGFLLGMLLFSLRDRLAGLRLGSGPMLAATAATLVLMHAGVSQFIVLAAVYVVAALTAAADMHAPPGPRIARLAPLGQLTYSVYMWHTLIILVVMNAIGDKFLHLSLLPMAALALLCYAIIAVVGYLSWTLIETPARRWIDKL
jgi:peptidoglycan/LPS O-acetylase OafA/YrhL